MKKSQPECEDQTEDVVEDVAFDPGHEAACAGSDVVQLASGECRLAPAGPGPGPADTRTLNTTVLYQAPVKQHNW